MDINKYEIYYSWDSMGTNMERHEELSITGNFYKCTDIDLILDDKDQKIQELEAENESLKCCLNCAYDWGQKLPNSIYYCDDMCKRSPTTNDNCKLDLWVKE